MLLLCPKKIDVLLLTMKFMPQLIIELAKKTILEKKNIILLIKLHFDTINLNIQHSCILVFQK